jgi:coniferyl-aldehyde dehydrogenase
MKDLFDLQRAAFATQRQPDERLRRDRLQRLLELTLRHEPDIAAAASQDFGHRAAADTLLGDVLPTLGAIRHAQRHLRRWMAPRRVSTPLHLRPGRSRILRQPLGVVGVISPWNYPWHLALVPAAAALAAGNRVMLKPSEHTPAVSALLARLVAAQFDAAEFAVVQGGAEVAAAFAALPFDHLFFTGSTAVGRKVALAAARNLTPVTLELGGKSPAIFGDVGDLAEQARRLAVGKLLNAGQTCIAPDYALVPAGCGPALAEAFASAVDALYPDLDCNADYTSIASDSHYARLAGLLQDARERGARLRECLPGGRRPAPGTRRLPPTLVLGLGPDAGLMQEEIFGPVLPILEYRTLDEAIAFVNARPRPLALYWFGRDRAGRDRVLGETLSGGVTVDDCLWHIGVEGLPFGGVGDSGMGAYHGERGFLAFTREKGVFQQSRFSGLALARPPYGKRFELLARLLRRLV